MNAGKFSEHPIESSSTDACGSQLAALVDEVSQRLINGENVDLDAICRDNPEIAEQFQQLIPSILAIANWSETSEANELALERSVRSKTLGDFRIVREVGRGGMGIVYEAEQISLDRRVALKVLPFAGLLDERHVQRFRNEARAAAMLKHPNIVSVHAVGDVDGTNFYVMDYIEGRSLDRIARPSAVNRSTDSDETVQAKGGTDPIAHLTTGHATHHKIFYYDIAKLGVQLANALQFAHDEGIIHRDIKPSNVLLDRAGRPHLTDFGLARIQTDPSLTYSGDIVGTLRYMSPEQLESTSFVDHRTDIYSLGLTLSELILGKPAFVGDSREAIIRDILDGNLPNLSRFDNKVPRDLVTILAKATCRDFQDRYATAQAFAADLQNFVDHRPITARKPTHREKILRWARRNPGVAFLNSLVLTLLLVITCLSVWMTWKERAHGRQQHALIESLQARDYDQTIRSAHLAIRNSDYRTAGQFLREIETRFTENTGTFEYRYIKRKVSAVEGFPKVPFAHHAFSVRYSPTGSHVIGTCFDGSISLIDADSQGVIWSSNRSSREGHQSFVFDALFTSHNEVISCGQDGTVVGHIKFWDRTTGELLHSRLIDDERRAFCLALSPSDDVLAAGIYREHGVVHENTIVVLFRIIRSENEAVSLKPWRTLEVGGSEVRDVSFSKDGRWLAAATKSNRVALWETSNYKCIETHDFSPAIVSAAEFSPTNSNQLLVGTNLSSPHLRGGDVYSLDVPNGKPNLVMKLSAPCRMVRWARDGRSIGACEISSSFVEIVNLASLKRRRLLGQSAVVSKMDFSPDGSTIVSGSADGTVCFMDLDSDPLIDRVLITKANGIAFALAFSRESRKLFAGYYERDILVWDLNQNTKPRSIAVSAPTVWGMDIANDDKTLAYCGGRWPTGDGTESVATINSESSTNVRKFPLQDRSRTTRFFPLDVLFVPPDDALLAAANGNGVRIWDRNTGAIKYDFRDRNCDSGVKHIDLDEQGRLLAAAYMAPSPAVVVWDLSTKEQVFRQEGSPNDDCFATALSADGELVANGFLESILIHRIVDGHEIKRITGHTGGTFGLDFSPDGTRLVSGGKDGTVNLWNLETGNCVLSFHFRHWVQRVRFSPDGSMIAVGCKDGNDNGVIHVIRSEISTSQ